MRQFVASAFARCILLALVAFIGIASEASTCAPAQKEIVLGVVDPKYTIQPPYFFGEFDSAGYSDWIWYGLSPTHNYAYHEMLSGEWASAIYYEGIGTDMVDPNNSDSRYAMWLTDEFIYPDWMTNSDFIVPNDEDCIAWNDPNNPTPEHNTSHTIIANDDVEITVDMEVVDLESISPGLRSPMSYRFPASSTAFYRNSDRYVILQTYTLRNLKAEPLDDIEFYQMLHAHPADEKSAALYSAYETQAFIDPLEDYIPHNPVHKVGNFRYDITQWNDINSNEASVDHSDWFSFSSTIEPNMIDHDVYNGHASGKPGVGTHINVENRTLNGVDHLYDCEPAAAMGWYMGSLEPGQTTSITFAIMFGYDDEIDNSIYLDITSEVSSHNPCGADPTDPNFSEIVYTIEYGNPLSDPNNPESSVPVQDATIINQLPVGVDFVSASNTDIFSYDSQTRECTWQIGLIEPGYYDQVTVAVNANTSAEPGSSLLSRALLTSEFGTVSDTTKTHVCCWLGTNIFYVDQSASGDGSGLNWENAYTDILDCFEDAQNGCASQILIAEGVYSSASGSGAGPSSVLLVDGVSVYGGFPAGGGEWGDRDFIAHKTVICGDYDRVGSNSVVDANDVGQDVVFDGFIILNGTEHGISCERSDLHISNCYIAANDMSGIKCNGSSPTITDCVIAGNFDYGLLCSDDDYCAGNPSDPEISHCKLFLNADGGVMIETSCSSPTITNNWVYENGSVTTGGSGITINDSSTPVSIRNNTIVGNLYIGIESLAGVGPEVENCIIWNHPVDLIGCAALYSCFQDAPDINGNISDDPEFAYDDPNDYHLSPASPCIDVGDPWNVGLYELDIDGDQRVYGTTVDMGADECACTSVTSTADFDDNRVVDFQDYLGIASFWLHDYSLSDPNTIYDIAPAGGDNTVDILDLRVLAEQWLWQPCWLENTQQGWLRDGNYHDILNLCSE